MTPKFCASALALACGLVGCGGGSAPETPAAGLTATPSQVVSARAQATAVRASALAADTYTASNAQRIVSKYAAVWTAPPTKVDTSGLTDAPLLGNGNVAASVIGSIGNMTFALGRNDFWSLAGKRVKAMARLNLTMPEMTGATHSVQQRLETGTVEGSFTLNGESVSTASWISADDPKNSYLVTKLVYTGTTPKVVNISGSAATQNTYPFAVGSAGNTIYMDAAADAVDQVSDGATPPKSYPTRKARVATTVLGATPTVSNGTLSFSLAPGGTYYLVSAIVGNLDSADYQATAINRAASATPASVETLRGSHVAWWSNFWSKSFVEIQDKLIEKQFYGSLYLMASASRSGYEPPGIWGSWATKDGQWAGDYHLNYNYEAPFYFAIPTNHVELTDNYPKPMLDFLPVAKDFATRSGFQGALYGVALGPLPNGSGGQFSLINQKSDGAFAVTNMVQRYNATRDASYAAMVYPVVSEVAKFWEHYLSFDGVQYNILNDAQREGDPMPQTNGIMSLGLVSYNLRGAIDMSARLYPNDPTEIARRSTWSYILAHLAPMPTEMRARGTEPANLKLRATTVGRVDDGSNCAVIFQGVYPAMQLGYGSDPTLLQAARNTADYYTWGWYDHNHSSTFYPGMARIGYNPSTILSKLSAFLKARQYTNFQVYGAGGGIENLNTAPAALAEMFMQTNAGVLTVFPNWPSDQDAKFGDLLADGNFLVSSAKVLGSTAYVRIKSKLGGALNLTNPWAGGSVAVYRNGVSAGTLSGAQLPLSTSVDEVIDLAPAGVSQARIADLLANFVVGGADATEAEYHQVGGGASVVAMANASGGYAVDRIGYVGPQSYLQLNLKVASAGTHNVTFRYSNTANSPRSADMLVNGSTSFVQAFPDSGGMTNWKTLTIPMTLNAGNNTLKINRSVVGQWAPAIDKVTVSP